MTLELSPKLYYALLTTQRETRFNTIDGGIWTYHGEKVVLVKRHKAVQRQVDQWRAEWDNMQYDTRRA